MNDRKPEGESSPAWSLSSGNTNYRELVQAVNSIIFRITPRGIILFANRFGAEFFGYDEGELTGRSVFDTVIPRSFSDSGTSRELKALFKCPQAHEAFSNENIKKDGTRVWVSWSNRGVFDDKGKLVEILSVGNDITPIKKMEAKLALHGKKLEAQVIEKTRELSSAAKFLENLFDGVDIGIFVLGIPKDNPIYFEKINSGYRQSRGVKKDGVFGLSIENFGKWITQSGLAAVKSKILECIRTGSPQVFQEQLGTDGEAGFWLTRLTPVKNQKGRVFRIIGATTDISDQKMIKDEIQLARKVFDNAVEGVLATDADGNIQFVNKGFSNITGYSEEEVIGKNPRILKSDRHGPEFYGKMWKDLIDKGSWAGEIWNRRKNGEAFPEWLSITSVQDESGNPVRYISVFHDLSDLRERDAQLRFQANYDALTGLPNRSLFKDRVGQAIFRASRKNHGLALIFLDIDGFKQINDSIGPSGGDSLLKQFCTRLSQAIRDGDTLARYRGDEFIILLPDTNDTGGIVQIIEGLSASLEKPFVIGKRQFYLGASFGISLYPGDGTDSQTLIGNADLAMSRSKKKGKGRYSFFTQELNNQVSRRFELEAGLRKALLRNEFSLFFQPKLDLITNQICGAEALVRWEHPENGIISPAEFIPLAEETGLIVPLGEWILDHACAKASKWSKKLGRQVRIAVNISSCQVRDVDLAAQVSHLLRLHGIKPVNLELEITESAVMENVEKAKTCFKVLHDMGVHISIDDFGTGFSSLSYLRLFPVTALKIDKSFVDDIPEDSDSNTMVKAIISMARGLNLITVAEGVEKKDQLEFLKENNCRQIQGYYFSPPLPEKEFFDLMKIQ